jgi:isochorismate synthase
MNESAPLCARFCLRVGRKTFIGATPERLVLRNGRNLTTEALAGSVSASDPNAERKLLDSKKDRREHALVVAAIQDVLAPLCNELHIPEAPEVRRLESIYHLRTPIEGCLREDVHILELVDHLHPTPAVGGLPRAPALAFIDSHESAERGWYAAPVGWVDAAGNGEFVVALRSGLIAGDKVHLYAGAGIVEGSESSAEYAETELKLAGMLGALGILPCADAAAPLSKQVGDGAVHP